MIPRACYRIVAVTPDVIIEDVGPWHLFQTVTNAAETVVAELVQGGMLTLGKRLFYFDSEGVLDELAHDGTRFVGFLPGPARLGRV